MTAIMKHMAANFSKLDKFVRMDFSTWQKKMHFFLTSMSVYYGFAKEQWDSLESKYMAKDVFSKKLSAISQLEYSKVIGCLMYAMTCTRPDIAFVVGKLSRYTSNPSTLYWKAVQRISNTEDNSSTSGLVFLLEGGAISWASKKQTCITSSTMESDFVALAAAGGKEYEWLKNLNLEIPLWSKYITPISICCDSATTLTKAYSQMYNGKS
ncbi:hypothetical protein Tco_0621502 [Tanacetum coccineum]